MKVLRLRPLGRSIALGALFHLSSHDKILARATRAHHLPYRLADPRRPRLRAPQPNGTVGRGRSGPPA